MVDLIRTLQVNTGTRPYSIPARLSLTSAYAAAGYPDLGAGEAYVSLLLLDELRDVTGEYHHAVCEEHGSLSLMVIQWWEVQTYAALARTLLHCGDLKSATQFCARGLAKAPGAAELVELEATVRKQVETYFPRGVPKDLDQYPERGLVRRQVYAWNTYERDRCGDSAVAALNERLSAVAPKLEVRAVEMQDLTTEQNGSTTRQLGIFAKEDLAPGELILDELSVLTATSRTNDEFCDACGAALQLSGVSDEEPVTCPTCEETVFCSARCFDASHSYHPALCGCDVSSIAKDAAPKDAADDLYSLLLLRTYALAQSQDLHPLELPEVRYIWGDWDTPSSSTTITASSDDPFQSHPRTLPFSFRSTIELPLHMLTKLDANVFTTYSTWVVNSLHAKFRDTASARQSVDGRPEVGAVHLLYCLANHSCNPNVRWDWNGRMRFWVRTGKEMVRWAGKDGKSAPGIKRNEQVWSHYCDVDLPVKERREWAAGALGGECRCERCVWEEGRADV